MYISANTFLWIQAAINFVFLLIMIRLVYTVAPIAFFRAQKLPFVPTGKYVAKTLKRAGVLDTVDSLVDLGSGDGQFIQHVQRYYPNITYYGVELRGILHWLATMRFKYSIRRSIRLLPMPILQQGDMFNFDLTKVDAVTGFWLPEFAEKLLPKFIADLREGSVIVSYMFPLALSNEQQRIFSRQIIICTPWWRGVTKRDAVYVYTKRFSKESA